MRDKKSVIVKVAAAAFAAGVWAVQASGIAAAPKDMVITGFAGEAPKGVPVTGAAENQRMMNGVVYTLEDSIGAARHFIRGNEYYKNAEYASAIAEYTEAISLMPFAANYRYARGIAYDVSKDRESAIYDFSDLIEMRPNDAAYRNARGVAYSHIEKYDLAVADHNAAISLRPRDANYHYNRAYAYCRLGEYRSATDDIRVTLSIDPGHEPALHLRAYIREELSTGQGRRKPPKPPKTPRNDPIGCVVDAHLGFKSLKHDGTSVVGLDGYGAEGASSTDMYYRTGLVLFNRARHLNKIGVAAWWAQSLNFVRGAIVDGYYNHNPKYYYVSGQNFTHRYLVESFDFALMHRLGHWDRYINTAFHLSIPCYVERSYVSPDKGKVEEVGKADLTYSMSLSGRLAAIGAGVNWSFDDRMQTNVSLYWTAHRSLEIIPSLAYYYGENLSGFGLSVGLNLTF